MRNYSEIRDLDLSILMKKVQEILFKRNNKRTNCEDFFHPMPLQNQNECAKHYIDVLESLQNICKKYLVESKVFSFLFLPSWEIKRAQKIQSLIYGELTSISEVSAFVAVFQNKSDYIDAAIKFLRKQNSEIIAKLPFSDLHAYFQPR